MTCRCGATKRRYEFFFASVAVLVSFGMSACGGSGVIGTPTSGPPTAAQVTEAAKTAFLKWNELAKRGDEKAAAYRCADPKIIESEAEPLPADHPGFNVPDDLNVQVSESSAVVDFLDRGSDSGEADDQDVFVNMVVENGSWKVCRYQATAPGGFG